jgi:hypothetical protein
LAWLQETITVLPFCWTDGLPPNPRADEPKGGFANYKSNKKDRHNSAFICVEQKYLLLQLIFFFE